MSSKFARSRRANWRSSFFTLPRPRRSLPCRRLNSKPSFFRYWTAKEAYLKAIGVGIANHLQEAISAVSDRGWSQWELIVAPHYAAAVATQTQGSAVQLCCWQWDWSQPV
jgi:phosphopantetheinyl transferase